MKTAFHEQLVKIFFGVIRHQFDSIFSALALQFLAFFVAQNVKFIFLVELVVSGGVNHLGIIFRRLIVQSFQGVFGKVVVGIHEVDVFAVRESEPDIAWDVVAARVLFRLHDAEPPVEFWNVTFDNLNAAVL